MTINLSVPLVLLALTINSKQLIIAKSTPKRHASSVKPASSMTRLMKNVWWKLLKQIVSLMTEKTHRTASSANLTFTLMRVHAQIFQQVIKKITANITQMTKNAVSVTPIGSSIK